VVWSIPGTELVHSLIELMSRRFVLRFIARVLTIAFVADLLRVGALVRGFRFLKGRGDRKWSLRLMLLLLLLNVWARLLLQLLG